MRLLRKEREYQRDRERRREWPSKGFVAQIRSGLGSPLPRMDLRHGDRDGRPEMGEAIAPRNPTGVRKRPIQARQLKQAFDQPDALSQWKAKQVFQG